MKKQIEILRLSARQAEKDDYKKAQVSTGSVFPEDSLTIQAYYKGYKQALDDLEQDDPAAGIDLLEEIKKIKNDFEFWHVQAVRQAEFYEGEDEEEMNPEEAYEQGCASAYNKTLYRVKTLLDKVDEEIIKREMEEKIGEEDDDE